jgi:hypothetical protein
MAESAISSPQSASQKPSARWLNAREILRGEKSRQSPQALKAAARMVLAVPVLQALLQVGVLNAEWWQALLGLEGLLIASLAASQLSQRQLQYRLLGLAMALLNAIALAAIGLFIGSHVFWISGLLGFAPFAWLLLAPTGPRTVKLANGTFVLLFALLLAGATAARLCVENAAQDEPAARHRKLQVAWWGFVIRGGNGTERAMLRLRMAQSAFAAGDYELAYACANDGLNHPDKRGREIPVSPVADSILRSLLILKAQAFYNQTWGKNDKAPAPLDSAPLGEELRGHGEVRLRFGW